MSDTPNDFNNAARVRSILVNTINQRNYASLHTLLTVGRLVPDTEALKAALALHSINATDILKLLVQHGACPDKATLNIAVTNNMPVSLGILLTARGAQADISMLRHAIANNYYQTANLLLSAGKVVPDTQLLKDLIKPAAGFKTGNRMILAKLLLDYGAKPDLETISYAVDGSWHDMVQMLAKKLPPGKKPSGPSI